jgi:hypothetical protein
MGMTLVVVEEEQAAVVVARPTMQARAHVRRSK